MEETVQKTESTVKMDTEVRDDLVRILGYVASMSLFLLALYFTIYTYYPQVAQDFVGLPEEFPYAHQVNDLLSFAVGSINNLFTYILLAVVGIISFTGAQFVEKSNTRQEKTRQEQGKEEEGKPGKKGGLTVLKKEEEVPGDRQKADCSTGDKPDEDPEADQENPSADKPEKIDDADDGEKGETPLPRDIGPEWAGIPAPEPEGSDQEPKQLTPEEIATVQDDPKKTALLLSMKEKDQLEISPELEEEIMETPGDTPEKHLVMAHARKIEDSCHRDDDPDHCKVETGTAPAASINKRENIREIRRRD